MGYQDNLKLSAVSGRKLVTVSGFARIVGVSAQAVRKAIDGGRLTAQTIGGRVMLDPVTAEAEWEVNRQRSRVPTQDRRATGNDGQNTIASELRSARLRKERAAAELAEIAAARARGELIETSAVRAAAIDIGTTTRVEVEQLPDLISFRLVAETDEATIHAILTEACEDVLRRIAAKSLSAVGAISAPDQGSLDLVQGDSAPIAL